MKKDLTSSEYWHYFGQRQLKPDELPLPKEAADYVMGLHVKMADKDREISELKNQLKIKDQKFDLFALEVTNLATKARGF